MICAISCKTSAILDCIASINLLGSREGKDFEGLSTISEERDASTDSESEKSAGSWLVSRKKSLLMLLSSCWRSHPSDGHSAKAACLASHSLFSLAAWNS